MSASTSPADTATSTGPSGGAGLGQLATAVEGLLVTLDRPLDPAEVAAAWELSTADVLAALNSLRSGYAHTRRGLALRETASGWRLFAADEVADQIRAVVVRETSARLSAAALETLAVIAYRQPVSRARVAAIRGVSVDAVVRTLASRGLVDVVDRDPITGAALYATTDAFLDAVGITALSELPDVVPLLPDADTVSSDEREELS